MKRKIYVFDICGTLYDSNTTFDFLSFIFSPISVAFRRFDTLRKTVVWRLFNKLARSYFHKDITRLIALRFLKGYTHEELVQLGQKFYDEFLKNNEHANLISTLNYLLLQEAHVVLVSATIDVVAEVIANRLGIKDWYGSQLLYKNGMCQGRLMLDLLGAKRNLLLRNNLLEIEAVYSDDLSDVPIFENAKQKNVVVYSKTKKRWKKIIKEKGWDVNFIEY